MAEEALAVTSRAERMLQHGNGGWLRVRSVGLPGDGPEVVLLERGLPGEDSADASVSWPLDRLDELVAALQAQRA